MSIIRDKLMSQQGEELHKAVFEAHLDVVSAGYDLEVAQAKHIVALHDFNSFCGFDISDAQENDYKKACEFLEEIKNEA